MTLTPTTRGTLIAMLGTAATITVWLAPLDDDDAWIADPDSGTIWLSDRVPVCRRPDYLARAWQALQEPDVLPSPRLHLVPPLTPAPR